VLGTRLLLVLALATPLALLGEEFGILGGELSLLTFQGVRLTR
jgi:hypothetical protein